jgi:hypothetical protein
LTDVGFASGRWNRFDDDVRRPAKNLFQCGLDDLLLKISQNVTATGDVDQFVLKRL